ncbi:MAG: ABC transporter ATP-binding protein [Candidatus Aenigmarchaeota archaeon]|nr:ABC transporter ATP-binding protein [Candidatus Aenigmarchaeota archaeon]
MDAIKVSGVSKKFKEKGKTFWALRDVSFSVKKGEIFGILGPNGAGKTTLLNIMIKLVSPDSGRIEILGKDVSSDNNILEEMNFVSGDTKFHWVLRADDIMNFYAMAYNIPKEKRKERIEKLLTFFGIDDIRERKFDDLSTGEKMRLIFAKAMLNRPKILLLDEPTLGLDPAIAMRVRDEIKRVNRKFGTTVILTSHYMNEIEQLSDRIAFIHDGRIIDMGKVESVKLKRFGTYDVIIKVKKVLDKDSLEKQGFQVSGSVLKKRLAIGKSISNVLSTLQKNGYEVLDIETKKPTLEDYFVKILKKGVKPEGA